MKRVVLGLLAHVDAGKTTLSESLLYEAGSIRKLGRVDHQSAFLDYNSQEKERGITIFSKQAILKWQECELTLIDTPGHVDFSSEMERVLRVLDVAVLVIDGISGVQAHTKTIYKLLKHYKVPVVIFVNKMDLAYDSKEVLMKKLQGDLSEACVDFMNQEELLMENISLCSDELLEAYLEEGNISQEMIQKAIIKQNLIPCIFGSALKRENIQKLLDVLAGNIPEKKYPEAFGARVFKITHEEGVRLTHMKITGGKLKARMKLSENEKVDQIRIYHGNKFDLKDEAEAGCVCAVKGLKSITAGEGLGYEQTHNEAILQGCMSYHMILLDDSDAFAAYRKLSILNEEDPSLHLSYQTSTSQIRVELMGEIQIEVLKRMIKDRFDLDVDFDEGAINYKETISNSVVGVGHYEPLRHYSEVHLALEPLPAGSGIILDSQCPTDDLDGHWQRQILSILSEKTHIGVLCGFPITDLKITLVSGKAHLKHTEGGDFREACIRAVRQGLMMAENVLLEPVAEYRLEIPSAYLSKAIYDIETMEGRFEIVQNDSDITVLTGSAPVKGLQTYASQVAMFSKGLGRLTHNFKGYEPCKHPEAILEAYDYDPERDLENPCSSVFCEHGAGFVVPWDEVYDYMHLHPAWTRNQVKVKEEKHYNKNTINEAELERVFRRTFGAPKPINYNQKSKNQLENIIKPIEKPKPVCLLVDGYNMIHSWKELSELAKENLDAARSRLIHILSSYQGFKNNIIILVFDAYLVEDQVGSIMKEHNIYVIYTKQAQTADMYIERATHELMDQYRVTVATSDGLEQLIISGQNAQRMSARELEKDIEYTTKTTMKEFETTQKRFAHRPLEVMRKIYHDED